MLISDRDICAFAAEGHVVLEPWSSTMVQPVSIDVRFGRYFRLFDNHKYAMADPVEEQPGLTRLFDSEDKPPILHPGGFVLGFAFEHVTLPNNIATRLEGKSSLGRLGLLTHPTASFIGPGFTGHITLELSNTATMPVALYPGMGIGQLYFFQMSSPSEIPHGSGVKGSCYQGQRGPAASRSYLNSNHVKVPSGRGIAEE